MAPVLPFDDDKKPTTVAGIVVGRVPAKIAVALTDDPELAEAVEDQAVAQLSETLRELGSGLERIFSDTMQDSLSKGLNKAARAKLVGQFGDDMADTIANGIVAVLKNSRVDVNDRSKLDETLNDVAEGFGALSPNELAKTAEKPLESASQTAVSERTRIAEEKEAKAARRREEAREREESRRAAAMRASAGISSGGGWSSKSRSSSK